MVADARCLGMTDDERRSELIAALRAADAVRFGEFELSHGGTSDYYVDKYLFETDPDALRLVSEAFADRLADTDAKLAGVALGAVPLVASRRRNWVARTSSRASRRRSTAPVTASKVDSTRARRSSYWRTSPRPGSPRSTPSKRCARRVRR